MCTGNEGAYMPKDVNLSDIRIGETNVAKNGVQMTIIAYRDNKDIDVQFATGEIAEHKAYNHFRSGKIGIPGRHYMPSANTPASIKDIIGATGVANNGLSMTIIAYRNCNDIDIQFSDGVIVTGKSYSSFRRGSVAHPMIKADPMRNIRLTNRVGEIRTTPSGIKMTIIRYQNAADIDVLFDTGELLTHVDYNSFNNGTLGSHNSKYLTAARVGEQSINHKGIPMELIKYNNSGDVDVQFSTGVVIRHKTYSSFLIGKIAHPFPHQIGLVIMDKPAYRFGDQGNFYCHCTKCGLHDIMTIPEMRDHICTEKGA